MTDTKFFSSQSDSYWETYLAARPDYSRSEFYERILSYHREQGNGSFGLAHNVACGLGQVAGELAKHFEHVVASDPNLAHVSVAKQRHQHGERKSVSYVTCLGEDLVQHAEPSSLDFMSCAEAMALMDMPRFLEAAPGVLKPGGTVAVWFYGRPHFLSSDGTELDPAVNRAYTALAYHLFASAIRQSPTHWDMPTQHMHCWLLDTAIPETLWSNVERHKINGDCEMSFLSPTTGGLLGNIPESAIGAHEACTSVVDRSF